MDGVAQPNCDLLAANMDKGALVVGSSHQQGGIESFGTLGLLEEVEERTWKHGH